MKTWFLSWLVRKEEVEVEEEERGGGIEYSSIRLGIVSSELKQHSGWLEHKVNDRHTQIYLCTQNFHNIILNTNY